MSHIELPSFNFYQVTWRLIYASGVAAIGAFQFGWNTGVINNPQHMIRQFVAASMLHRFGHVSDDSVTAVIAAIVAIFAAGGLFGALAAGWWADKLGRRIGMMVNNLIMLAGGSLMLCSTYAYSYEMIILGRFIVGFGSGLYTGLVPIYLSEIAPPHIRGSIGVLMQLGVVFGIFLSQAIGLSSALGSAHLWNFLLGIVVPLAFLQAVCLQFCPSSPRYMLYFKDDEASARLSLFQLRSEGFDVDKELDEMKLDIENNKEIQQMNLMGILRHRSLRLSLLVGVVLHFSQQFSGINNIFYYSSTLFESIGVAKGDVEYATLGVGIVMIVVTLISIILIERVGRRLLHIGGLGGCLVTAAAFTIFYTYKTVASFNYLSIISALLLVASFGIGPGSIPWIVLPELFPEGCRSTATAVGISVNWLSNLVVGLIFPYLLAGLGSLIFLPYIMIHAICIVFLFFKMPETRFSATADNDTDTVTTDTDALKSSLDITSM